ncbi:MAG: hypothetical protein R2781_12510 [Flavobacteriaceae bacterium]
MNPEKYITLLADKQPLASKDLQDISTILSKYPYFQSARALQLKGLKNENSFLYNDALKKTAAYTTDRDVLFDYITSEEFIQNEISEHILQHSEALREMDVISENISEQINLEINKQLKAEIQKAEAILDPTLFERKVWNQQEAEKILKINEPLSFTKTETHSFTEWLKLTKATPIDRNPEETLSKDTKNTSVERKFELIERFIQEKKMPLERIKNTLEIASEKNTNLAEPYTKASESLMTETLAKVYLQQKNYTKAIQAYKILILKNPEKSGFFADQIRAIQKLIKE